MDRLISLQAVLDAFGLSEKTRKYSGDHSGYNTMMLYEIQDVIEDLPSVSTEKTALLEQVRWERDVAISQLHELGYEFGEKIEQQPCIDAVSREAAYKCLEFKGDYDTLNEAYERLSKLLPVNTEKTGRWIPIYGNVKCSVCGSVKDSREVGKATHYCDFCGAKMVEPQKSEELREKNISKGFEDFMTKVLREQKKAESEE